MVKRRLGATGPEVSAAGLGCMAMSDAYGPADESEALATVRAALESGVTLIDIDTGDFYGMGHNELLIRDAAARPAALTRSSSAFSSGRCVDLTGDREEILPTCREARMAHLDSEA